MDHVGDAKGTPPNPSLPKTIGVLNLLFGGLLLLCGMGWVTTSLPALTGQKGMKLDPKDPFWQNLSDEMKQRVAAELKKKEDATADEAEKARIRGERRKIEAKDAKVVDQVDFARLNAALAWVPRYVRAEVLSGPILNLLMLIAGIGLVRLKSWGRTLGVAVAALKIVRLAGLCVFLSVFVIPPLAQAFGDLAKTDFGEAIFTKAMEDQRAQRGGNAPATVEPKEFVQVLKVMGYGYAYAFAALGSIYPVIALVVLTRPGAKAACSGSDESEPELRDAPEGFP